jgi:hypothetical protein
MNIQRDTLTLPRAERGAGDRIEVNINLSAEIHITATVAQRRVSRLVISEIGNLL